MSRDGKYAAYITKDGAKQSIRLRQIATPSDVEIVSPTENLSGDLSFSPDGNYLYYIQSSDEEDILFKVPALGGSPTKITGNLDKDTYITSSVAVSPDGKTIAFRRGNNDTSFLQLAKADGTDERTIIKFSEPIGIRSKTVAWSPDGKTVAYGVGAKEKGGMNIKLFGINVSDGAQHQLSESEWSEIGSIEWLSDGNLIVSGKEKSDMQFAPSQLWLVAPNSPPLPITNDRFGYNGVSITAQGDLMMAVISKMPRNLWILPENDASRAKQVTTSGEIVGGLKWTPDGKFLVGSNASGNADIWMMNADGTNRRQLTVNKGTNVFPSMTSDGRFIIFNSNRIDFTSHIFRMNGDGSNQIQLTNGLREFNQRLSLDGKWIYYIEETPGNDPNKIRKVSIDGATPVGVANIRMPSGIAVSPRTGLIAYVNSEDKQKGGLAKIIILSPDGGTLLKTLSLPLTAPGGFIQWTPDERAIAFNDTRNGSANIWAITLDGKGEAKPLTNFTTEQTLNFDWSPDGKQFAASRGTATSEAVLISKAK